MQLSWGAQSPHKSVLWWATKPRAPYIFWATSWPRGYMRSSKSKKGKWHWERLHTSTGQ